MHHVKKSVMSQYGYVLINTDRVNRVTLSDWFGVCVLVCMRYEGANCRITFFGCLNPAHNARTYTHTRVKPANQTLCGGNMWSDFSIEVLSCFVFCLFFCN